MRRGEDGTAGGVDIRPGPGHAGWASVTDLWRPRFADFLHDQRAARPGREGTAYRGPRQRRQRGRAQGAQHRLRGRRRA